MQAGRSFFAARNGKQRRLRPLSRRVFVDADDKCTTQRIGERDDFRSQLILRVVPLVFR